MGVIGESAPCTAYHIHQTFLSSPSLFFSGSAGAIYPLVRRMKERGLVRSESAMQGRRRSELLSLTEEGRRLLDRWMRSADLISDPGFDPVRARVSLLPSAWRPDERRTYLVQLAEALERRLELIARNQSSGVEQNDPRWWALRLEMETIRAKIAVIRERLADNGGA